MTLKVISILAELRDHRASLAACAQPAPPPDRPTTSVIIVDVSTDKRIAVLTGDARETWQTARACVNGLARDAGPARVEASHREWFRLPGLNAYQRGGFRAVNVFRANGSVRP